MGTHFEWAAECYYCTEADMLVSLGTLIEAEYDCPHCGDPIRDVVV